MHEKKVGMVFYLFRGWIKKYILILLILNIAVIEVGYGEEFVRLYYWGNELDFLQGRRFGILSIFIMEKTGNQKLK